MLNIIRIYKKTENKEHREWFLLLFLGLLILISLIFLTFFFEYRSGEYYRANSGLFVINIMIFLIFIAGQQKTKMIFSNLKRVYSERDKLTLSDYGDILLLIVYATAMLSFIFILDLTFIENYGIRISAVVSVTIVKLLKDLYWTKK